MSIIEMPKDARGREIPLDAKYVYTRHGKALDVIGFCLMETDRGTREWTVWTKVAKYRPEDVLVNRPKKTTPQNAAQANKGVTLSTLPEYATPNEWAEAFNVSLRTVYRMCSLGELMTVKVRGSILIYRDSSFVLLGLDR